MTDQIKMGNAPERIWATGNKTTGSWNHEPMNARIAPEQTEYVRADLAPAPSWQPIETAPKDGSEILLTDGEFPAVCEWSERYQDFVCSWNMRLYDQLGKYPATHWMPLPVPPTGDT